MIEEQMKIEQEKQKLKKKEDKRAKTEQKKILGKDNSRPKLSFAISQPIWVLNTCHRKICKSQLHGDYFLADNTLSGW